MTISGRAKDNIDIDFVQVSLNGHSVINATLGQSTTLGTPWSVTPSLVQGLQGGLNNVQVFSTDKAGNTSAIATRSFTFVEKGSLVVNAGAGGTVTGALAGATAYQVGKTYALTAKPAAGFVFDHWVVPGVTPGAASLQTAVLSFVYTDAILANHTIRALFVATPYVAANIGAFNGLITPHKSSGLGDPVPAAVPSNSTTGFVNVVVTPTGTFTGTLKIDGLSLSFSGLFDPTGTARFGATRDTSVLVPRVTKPAVELMLHLDLDLARSTAQITGTVRQYLHTTLISISDVLADRAAFSASQTLTASHPSYLVNKGASRKDADQRPHHRRLPPGLRLWHHHDCRSWHRHSQRHACRWHCRHRQRPAQQEPAAPLFAQLYTGKNGSFSGLITLNDAIAGSDLKALDCSWFRPSSNTQ